MGEFPNKSTQFSKDRQPENRGKRDISSKTILNRFLSIEKDMINPLNGLEEKLTISEIMHLKQLANAIQGDLGSYKEILDRIEGKTKQSFELDANIEQNITRITVKKRDE
jgi:hypothetical protein